VHENCCNYGGMGGSYSLRLLENVPGLKLLFDTGNPPRDIDYDPGPTSGSARQSSWKFYQQVKDHVAHVHIKDAVWEEASQRVRYTWPGEGQGDVARVVADLLRSGYSGALSIEPHMVGVFHNGTMESGAPNRVGSYVEYGRRLEALVDSHSTEEHAAEHAAPPIPTPSAITTLDAASQAR
jgi:sugar phosphate isomerase/epimerase